MTHDGGAADQAARRPDDPAGRQQRQCIGKRGYLNPDEAKDHAKAMHKKYKAKFKAYPCPWCSLWHTGTVRTTRQQERRRAASA